MSGYDSNNFHGTPNLDQNALNAINEEGILFDEELVEIYKCSSLPINPPGKDLNDKLENQAEELGFPALITSDSAPHSTSPTLTNNPKSAPPNIINLNETSKNKKRTSRAANLNSLDSLEKSSKEPTPTHQMFPMFLFGEEDVNKNYVQTRNDNNFEVFHSQSAIEAPNEEGGIAVFSSSTISSSISRSNKKAKKHDTSSHTSGTACCNCKQASCTHGRCRCARKRIACTNCKNRNCSRHSLASALNLDNSRKTSASKPCVCKHFIGNNTKCGCVVKRCKCLENGECSSSCKCSKKSAATQIQNPYQDQPDPGLEDE